MSIRVTGRLLAAGRTLAGMTVRELAEASGVDKGTISELEGRDAFDVAPVPERRVGMVAGRVWSAIVAALATHGVEFVPGDEVQGEGVRRIVDVGRVRPDPDQIVTSK